MRNSMTMERDAAEDIFFGQAVIHWARWFVIAAGTGIILLTADTTSSLILGIAPVLAMIALNFYIHGRRMVEKPANARMVIASSVIDVALITLAVAIGAGTDTRGLDSQFYVVYFPVVLAFAFVMQRPVTIAFTAATAVTYVTVCVVMGVTGIADTSPFHDSATFESLVSRTTVLVATAGIGSYFWRIQRNRRREAAGLDLA